MRYLYITLLALLPAIAFSQSNPLDVKLEKAYKYIKEDKLDDAEEYLEKLLNKNPEYGEGWDLLVKVRYRLFEQAKQTDGLMGKVSITSTTTDKNGKKTQVLDDTLAKQLTDMLNTIRPSEKAYSKAIYTMRKATALSRDAVASSMYLRSFNVDVNVDSNLNKKALKSFEQAEEQFAEKNYNKAALLYRRALEEQPDFYKAALYLGDCYYATENYTEAIKAFKAASDRFPFALEPRKYLVDAYAKSNLYDKATAEAINAMAVYPDYSMMTKLEDAVYLDHKTLQLEWTPRGVLPNRYVDAKEDINEYTGDSMVAQGPWVSYVAAYKKAAPYTNKAGILKANSLTQSRYLEVYSWEEMLKNSNDPLLEEARRMQKLNYLDCYVLVSCFHYDLYPQYLDFAKKNPDKIANYYKALIKYRNP